MCCIHRPTVLVLACAVIATFYIRRSQARGVGTRVRPYVVAGIILGLALVVLSWGERNGELLAFALGYSAVVLVTATFGPAGLGWPVQLVIPGSVLLPGGIGFLLAQRPWAEKCPERPLAHTELTRNPGNGLI